VDNTVQTVANSVAEGEDSGIEPVVTPEENDTEDDDTTVISPAG
jgi:hypothetical protein